jgi:hypothetical protein
MVDKPDRFYLDPDKVCKVETLPPTPRSRTRARHGRVRHKRGEGAYGPQVPACDYA